MSVYNILYKYHWDLDFRCDLVGESKEKDRLHSNSPSET